MLHLPAIGWLGIGIGIPLGIAALIPLAEFVYDRAHWAAFDFGRFGPPDPWFYLPHPAIWMVFDYFFAALVEEVVCRGVLQQFFARRFGTGRGIFLVSIVWAAAHFHLDARAGLQATDFGELVTLVWRVLACLTLGYTLSWLTIRSASLWPAIIVHTLYNFLRGWGAVFEFRGRTYVEIGIWAVLAAALFRFWPLRQDENEKVLPPVEPALGL